MTEQKIREAFEKWLKSNGIEDEDMFRFAGELDPFTAGYLALLNALIGMGADSPELYRLPEGVNK